MQPASPTRELLRTQKLPCPCRLIGTSDVFASWFCLVISNGLAGHPKRNLNESVPENTFQAAHTRNLVQAVFHLLFILDLCMQICRRIL